ncbi:unnamed protein product [Oncorhynchus mykiss]|uniref:protein-serine/threonine phosphatase n=1 Tax=Oncorhynchus mykiss TaxID=8022 RepID=A0A060Y189_ONCMY|nr:unnamed protein product [Oncorhynchus mykiss]
MSYVKQLEVGHHCVTDVQCIQWQMKTWVQNQAVTQSSLSKCKARLRVNPLCWLSTPGIFHVYFSLRSYLFHSCPQVVEDGYEFFAKRQLVTLFSAPNYCGEFDNAGAMMSVDETLMCSFQILKPADKKLYSYGGGGGMGSGRPVTPPRNSAKGGKAKK